MSSADSDGRIIMASESAASPDDNADATALPQRPSPLKNETAQEIGGGTDVGDSTAAPQDAPRDGMTAPAVSALSDDGPSIPVRQAVDHGRESMGPQLHDDGPDGPPGPPPCFPHEFDDSLAKGDVVCQEEEADGPQLHDGLPGPPSFPHEFDDSLFKGVGNELERRPPDHSRDNASAVHSTMGASVSSTAALGSAAMSLLRAVATAAVTRSLPSAGRSTILAEAYTVEEAEGTPGGGIIYQAEPAIPSFYQRKGFLLVMFALALLAVTATGVLLLYNPDGNSGGVEIPSEDSLIPVPGQEGAASPGEAQTSSAASDLQTPVPTMNVPTKIPTTPPILMPSSNPTNNPTDLPTRNNLTTRPPVNSSLTLLAPDGAAYDYFGRSAAISQDTIVVGADGDDDGDDDNGISSGSAHIIVRNGEEWKHKAKLQAPDGAAGDRFGRSVAIYEDTIVVVAYDDDNGDRSGSAHVFVRSGEDWMHQAKLLAPDGTIDKVGQS
ncbi:hypothetical protein THAOC_26021, partial [Thalassiosira oceanica]